MNRAIAGITALLLIVSCGGGSDHKQLQLERAEADLRAATQATAASRAKRPDRRVAQAAAAGATVDAIDAATQLMDFGEANFPQYFPSRQFNRTLSPYLYRSYPETGAYLGVADGFVYVMGGPFGAAVVRVGPLASYVTPVPQRAAAVLGSAGGTLRIDDATSPVNGVVIDVPAAALPGDATVAIAKAHGPVVLDGDLRALGPIVDVDLGGAALLKPVRITLPFDRSRLAAGQALGAFGSFEGSSGWYALPVVGIDASRSLLSVETLRASRVVAAALPAPAATQASTFRPSLNGFRIANVAAQTLTTTDLGAGFTGFASWYASAHPGCPNLGRLSDAAMQRTIVTAAQASSQADKLAVSATASALSWADFNAVAARELARGRPAIVAHAPTAGGTASALHSSASLIWERRADGGGRLAIYQPARGPDDTVAFTSVDYTRAGSRTSWLPWPELFDAATLREVFEQHKASLGCVPPTVTLTATPAAASTGQTTQLRWTASNALSCTASGGWSGSKSVTGGTETVSVGTSAGTRSYAIDCAGVEGSSASARASVTVTASACASIGGRWTETATVDLTCDSGDNDSTTQTGTGTITQNGCSINYSVAGVARSGRVEGLRVTFSGPAAIATPGAVLTVNTFSAEGTVSADWQRIDVTGNGEVAGQAGGISDRCTIRSRSVLRR